MDFLKLIRSFEDLLFEVLTWLFYYPRTLWMVLSRPLQMVDYSNHEQGDGELEQYTDTLSPPLLLLLTIMLLHGIELQFGGAHIQAASEVAQEIVSSDQNLVLLRSFLFGLLPLFSAIFYVRHRKLGLERKYLRAPFFSGCYLAAVYALAVSLSSILSKPELASTPALAGVGAVAGTIWWLTIQSLQFKAALGMSAARAFVGALGVLVKALAYLVLVGLLITGVPDSLLSG